MNGWQDILALACVALAATYILWRVGRKLFKRGGSTCGGCSSCESSAEGQRGQQIVSLTPPKAKP